MTVLNLTSVPKSPIRTATNSGYGVTSSIKGESVESKQVATEVSHQDRTQLSHIFESANIAEFERRAEHLKDLLEANRTALSEQEIHILKELFNNSSQYIKLNKKTFQLKFVALASLLEPLIKNDAYSHDIAAIVRNLLKSSSTSLRYAALDIITSGLEIVPIATSLLEEAKVLLKDEKPGYVLDYLESL
jgi:hypothetical protein